MFRRWQMSGCLVTLLGLIACSEPQGDPATGPELDKGVGAASAKPGGSPTDCDFASLHGYIVAYFPGPQQNDMDALVSSMEGTSDLGDRRVFAYQLMDAIGVRSRAVSLSESELLAGENLTKGLIKCSYDASNTFEFPNFPDGPIYDFRKALNAADGGAYFVKGETADSLPVLARVGGGPVYSGMAPPLDLSVTPDTSFNWDGILSESVLIYGWVESNPAGSYEWALIRPNAIFDPEVVIALCEAQTLQNQVIFESNMGYLAYGGDGQYICNGTVTGTGKTLRSKLSPAPLDPDEDIIVLGVPLGPGKTQKAGVEFTILVSAKIDGVLTNAVCALLTGFNNSGQSAVLLDPIQNNCGNPGFKQLARKTETTFLELNSNGVPVTGSSIPCTPSITSTNCKPYAGHAVFKVTIPSPGAMSMTVTGVQTTANNNLTLDITTFNIPKFNVRP
jgi:hypothetical protein